MGPCIFLGVRRAQGEPALVSVPRLAVRLFALAVALVVMWQLISWTEPVAAFAVLERFTPNLVWRVNTARPLVALSFDDGPDPEYTPKVLAILARHAAHATFFVIGERAMRYPELIGRIGLKGTRSAITTS